MGWGKGADDEKNTASGAEKRTFVGGFYSVLWLIRTSSPHHRRHCSRR